MLRVWKLLYVVCVRGAGRSILNDEKFSNDKRGKERVDQFCQMCGVSSKECKLVTTSWKPPNRRTKTLILCTPCLAIFQISKVCASEREKLKANESYVTELQVSRRKQIPFRLYVFARLQETEDKRLPERDLINSGAEVVGISTTTARRYLDKMCSSAGVLERKYDGDEAYISFKMEGLLKR